MLVVAILSVIATVSTIGCLLFLSILASLKEYLKIVIVKETYEADMKEAAKKALKQFFG